MPATSSRLSALGQLAQYVRKNTAVAEEFTFFRGSEQDVNLEFLAAAILRFGNHMRFPRVAILKPGHFEFLAPIKPQ